MSVLIQQATDRQLKALAKRLQTVIPEVLGTAPVPLNQAQRIVAKGLGHADFHAALAFHTRLEADNKASDTDHEARGPKAIVPMNDFLAMMPWKLPAAPWQKGSVLFGTPTGKEIAISQTVTLNPSISAHDKKTAISPFQSEAPILLPTDDRPTLAGLIDGLRWVETDENLAPSVMAGTIRFLEAWFPVAEAAWPGQLSWHQVRRALLHGAVLELAHRPDVDMGLRQPLLQAMGQWQPRDAEILGMALIWGWRSDFLIGSASQVEQQLREEHALINQYPDSTSSQMWAGRSEALLKVALAGLADKIMMTREELWQRMSFPSLILRSRDPREPKAVRDVIAHYLSKTPGFSLAVPPTRTRMSTREQHGFVQMQWARQLSPSWSYRAAWDRGTEG